MSLLFTTGALAAGAGPGEFSDSVEPSAIHPLLFCLLLFLGCTVIGFFATLGGVGGGVIFTPLFMGFTPIDSYIIRTTGLFVAMAGTLVATRPFLYKGIANIRLLLFAAVPYTLFAVVGALLAGYIDQTMGAEGEAFIRGALGVVILVVGVLFIIFGGRTDYPDVTGERRPGSVRLSVPYWEDSLSEMVRYRLRRRLPGLVLFGVIGLISGLLGIGAGGALVPVFNLVMLAPLKVAATCSTVMISLGGTAAVWPYILGGGMFPLVAVPCMLGILVGARTGARVMLRVRAGFVRWIIIALMIAAGIRLIVQAFEML